MLDDVILDSDGGGGCQSSHGDGRITHAEDGKLAIVFTEVLTPMRHAVALVYHKAGDLIVLVELV